MSCLLEKLCCLDSLYELQNWLCPHLIGGSQSLSFSPSDTCVQEWQNEGWGNDWENLDTSVSSSRMLNRDEKEAAAVTTSPSAFSWLSECLFAMSPTGDIMTVACRNRISVLTSRWVNVGKGNDELQYTSTWKGTVGQLENDEIRCLLCLPLISQKQSSIGQPDWTCIVVGFASGHVSMYTENGLLLLSQQFEISAVVSIKCRSYSCTSTSEELMVLYPEAVTTVDGFSLCQTLRACRSQLAKATARGGDGFPPVPPLGYKKWGLVDLWSVFDCCSVGQMRPVAYDHLANDSLMKGFHNTVNIGVPACSLFVMVGRDPFMSFLIAKEGVSPPFMADVAYHYASKLKNALVSTASGWLFGQTKTKDSDSVNGKPKIEKAVPLPYRWSIPDIRRTGRTIHLAPCHKLAAVTDDFGRVNLIDVGRGVVLRMWKGYREAECGWIELDGEWGGVKRGVSFLVIYSPRRGLLEVWTPHQGPRVAAFNVPKYAKLLYTPHTMLGVTNVRPAKCKMFPVLLLTPDGNVHTLSVPFHLALGGKSGQRARDLLLLKMLKIMLREGSPQHEVLDTLGEIRSVSARLQAVTVVVGGARVTEMLVRGLCEAYQVKEAKDHDECALRHHLKVLSQLTDLYEAMDRLHALPSGNNISPLVQDLARRLVLTVDETEEVIRNCNLNQKKEETSQKSVKFEEEAKMRFSSFIRCWELSCETKENVLIMRIKKETSNERKCFLGKFMFGWPTWESEDSLSHFRQAVICCNADDLLQLCLIYWCHLVDVDIGVTCRLADVLMTVSLVEGAKVPAVEDQSVYWSAVREQLINWHSARHAYLVAMVCRGVQARLEAKTVPRKTSRKMDNFENVKPDVEIDTVHGIEDLKVVGNEPHLENLEFELLLPSLNEWEGLSMEMVEWNLLISRLLLLLPLDGLLKWGCDVTDIGEVSVRNLMQKGKGYVSELFARKLIVSKVSVEAVLGVLSEGNAERQEKNTVEKEEKIMHESDHRFSSLRGQQVILTQQLLREILVSMSAKFPNSMLPDVLFANLAWEAAAGWNKMPDTSGLLLNNALQYSQAIENVYVRHGLCVMIWGTWLCPRVQSSAKLIEKVGKLPKERLCRRDLGVGEHCLKQLFEDATALLNIIVESNGAIELEKPLCLEGDPFWTGCTGSQNTLVELAVSQKFSCGDMVGLHVQLVSVLRLLATYDLKNVRPFSYFGGQSRSVFFRPLHSDCTLHYESHDPSLTKARLVLLCRVITALVASLPDTAIPGQENTTEIQNVLDLAIDWGVSTDILRRHIVCEFYTSGLDKSAQEAIPAVTNGPLLGSQLLLIAGQRLNYHLLNSPHIVQFTVLTSPTIMSWIKSCDASGLRYPQVPLSQTLSMVTNVLNLLPEGGQEYKMAASLFDTFSALRD